MYTLVDICVLVVLLTSLFSLVGGKGTSHYDSCPSGYDVSFKSKCYKIDQRYKESSIPCPLARIESEEENNFVKEMMNERGEKSLWIRGQQFNSAYRNYEGSVFGICVFMKPNGRWKTTYYCKARRRPLCAVLRPCEGEWVGLECDRMCHCYKTNCSRVVKSCYTGCDPGWTGSYCDQEIPKPVIENYCFKNQTHFAMILAMNIPYDYESLVPIDSTGHAINPGNFPQKYKGREAKNNLFLLELTSEDLSLPFVPNYHEKKIDETTFDWSFRLREVNDVIMSKDLDFRVRCNFSQADNMDTSVTLDLKKDIDRGQYSLSPSDISVQLFFTDPFDVAPLENIDLGQPVKLALTQKVINVSVDNRFYLWPRKCFAISKDKLVVKQLSDADGCPMQNEIFKRFHFKGDGQIVTGTFTSFGMPGDPSFEISCSLVACYLKDEGDCFKSCNYPLNSRLARSVMDIKEPVFMEISSTINIR